MAVLDDIETAKDWMREVHGGYEGRAALERVEAEVIKLQDACCQRNEIIEKCAKIADLYPGVYGNSPTASEIRKLKTNPEDGGDGDEG